jgi:hypothetical protein
MSITSVKSGATGISLALDNNFMEPIATTLVGSGGATVVTFNDIPQTYKHLQLRGIVRSTTSGSGIGDNVDLRFNGDNGSNYARHLLQGDGASVATSTNTSGTLTRISVAPRSGVTASTFTGLICDILDYTNTNKYKTLRTLSGVDANGSGTVFFISGLWMSTSEVTSITLLPEANSFAQYSRFSLYGIKG